MTGIFTDWGEVSIPQAVSTVATVKRSALNVHKLAVCFNTASGKYCCNLKVMAFTHETPAVSFNTASGKYCCNL